MPRYITKEEAFLKCKKEGCFNVLENIDVEKIKSTVNIAQADIESAEILKTNLSRDSKKWSSVYKLYYDALHELTEAFLRFDKVKSDNHQGLFAYLCEKHPELDFDWNFFEKVRTKRNGINYYGTPVIYSDFKEIEVQLILYLNTLRKEVELKISAFRRA